MALLNLIPYNMNINFVRKKFIFFSLSGFLVFSALLTLAWSGLNLGVDFRGGLAVVVRLSDQTSLENIRQRLSKLDLGDFSLQEFGNKSDLLIRIKRQPGGDEAQIAVLQKLKDEVKDVVEFRQVETVGPTAGKELVKNGMYAVLWAIFAMLVYIWFRFEWQFAVCGVLALLHDAVAILGFYSLTRLEFNITTLVAILITIAYSINDTVVVYDRIRENLRKYKRMEVTELLNRSINETLSRTILTAFTTLLALIALYFLGGEVIAQFSLPIIIGISVGTYSSICIASLALLYLNIQNVSKAEPVKG